MVQGLSFDSLPVMCWSFASKGGPNKHNVSAKLFPPILSYFWFFLTAFQAVLSTVKSEALTPAPCAYQSAVLGTYDLTCKAKKRKTEKKKAPGGTVRKPAEFITYCTIKLL
jgi:hypothetical protein